MLIDMPVLIGDVGFNYERDNKEFKTGLRKVQISSLVDDKHENKISLSLDLGRVKDDDDYLSVTFDAKEFIQKLIDALVYGDHFYK